jgi:HSP20 family protein
MIRPGIWRRELTVPLQSLQSELNRLFEEYWHPGTPGATAAAPTDLATAVWTPALDLSETPSELVLVVDLSLTDNVLSLRGEKVVVESGADAHNRVRERPIGSFHRQVTLTEAVDFDRVSAEVKNGVLTVRLPKQEAAKPRTIPIQPVAG